MARVCKDCMTRHKTWKPIPGYEGYYEVSDDGLVRSVDREYTNKLGRVRRKRGRELKPQISSTGYVRYWLCKEGAEGYIFAHRAVALAFHPIDGSEDLVVRHLDHDPANNVVENLAWGTHKENAYDSMRDGRLKGNNQHADKTECPQGHPYDYTYPDGRRGCKRCTAEAVRRHRARKV